MTDWQDVDSKPRLEKCRGCDFLAQRMQERAWNDNGLTRRPVPKKVMHWWCKWFKLHLEFIDRLVECQNEQGVPKECPHFKN